MIARAALALVLLAPAAAAAPPRARADPYTYDLRAGAWDCSVELERTGHLREARALLVRAWGREPAGYEVSVRLGWLSLKLGDGARAAREYRHARTLPGAGPEATQGLASALTLEGYDELEDGDRGAARGHWRAALALDPAQDDARKGLDLARAQRIDPELWVGYVGERIGTTQGDGLSVFALLPLQLSDHFRLRAAYRVSWLDLRRTTNGATSAALGAPARRPRAGPGSGMGGMGGNGGQGANAASTSGETLWHEQDAYLGFGFGGADAWLDVLGMAILPSDERAVPGQAAQLRLGRRFGIDAVEATLRRQRGWNAQVAPHAFVWPVDWLALWAGPRFTIDEQGDPASIEAGVTLATRPFQLYVSGHAGTQRWPVSPAVPLVLTLDQDLPLGGSAALLFAITPHWSLGLSSELEKLSAQGDDGTYTSFAAGLGWSPRF